jgi:hypothetical protein
MLAAVTAAALLVACQKAGVTNTTGKLPITVSKSSVKLGEPLYVSAASSNGALVKWSVTPAGGAHISQGAANTVILFTHAGTYTVAAGYYNDTLAQPFDTTSTTVTVSDSVYNDSATAHCNVIISMPIDSTDEITITPVSYTDSGLVLLANTRVLYNNSPALGILYPPVYFGEYEFIFNSVLEYPCDASQGPAPATAVLGMGALTPGTHPVIFKLLGVDYTGSVEVTGTQCTFTWPYTSGVVIQPLQVSKR